MTLHGVGVDVADSSRLRRLLQAGGDRFARRWFSGREVAECAGSAAPELAFAERFAAKEAVWKAISVPWDGSLPWARIEVVRGNDGLPEVRLDGRVAEAARLAGVTSISVSWSSTGRLATAVALAGSD